MVPGRDFYFSFSVSGKNILGSHWHFSPKNREIRESVSPVSNLHLTFYENPARFIPKHPRGKKDHGVPFFETGKIAGNSNLRV
jgi:hypothetical protein